MALLAPLSPFEASSNLSRLGELEPAVVAAALLAWAAAWFFACLRLAFGQAIATRILERVGAERRAQFERPLTELAPLAESANLFESAFALLFALLMLLLVAEEEELGWKSLTTALVISVPALWIATRGLAQAVSLRYGDAWVSLFLPSFRFAQLPVSWLVFVFRGLRRGLMRALGLPDDAEAKREIVAGLREVIAGAEISGKLDESEREMIGNVMGFRDVDAAAVMTPRTEVHAVPVDATLREAARLATEFDHERLPVFEGSLDSVIGSVSMKELLRALAEGAEPPPSLRELVHPAYFVPETKRISELLAEFRREKLEMAIVVDEYGGTAGLVTSTDILEEIVGDLPTEGEQDEHLPVTFLSGGIAEVDASTHVSEVNKVLDLELPETADFETLGGFVLAELGRFPERGEKFTHEHTEFHVVESSDRRVLRVRVRKLAASAH